jgi:hypothetical protein
MAADQIGSGAGTLRKGKRTTEGGWEERKLKKKKRGRSEETESDKSWT